MEFPEVVQRKHRTLVLALGSAIMGDDGAGRAALELLRTGYALPDTVDLVDGGVLGLGLLDALDGYPRVLVLDCVTAGEPPGTVVRLDGEAVPAAFTRPISPHQTGLSDVLATLGLLGRAPEHLTVIGVEPGRIELGLELSDPVQAALPRMARAAADVLTEWGLRVRPRRTG